MFVIRLYREVFTPDTTIGTLYLNGDFFCYTLEDAVRGPGIKIPGHTAIPVGTYDVDVTPSKRFARQLPILYNQENGYELNSAEVTFKGIRLHGGNHQGDAKSSIIVAHHYISDIYKIWGSAEKALTEKLIMLGRRGVIIVQNDKNLLFKRQVSRHLAP